MLTLLSSLLRFVSIGLLTRHVVSQIFEGNPGTTPVSSPVGYDCDFISTWTPEDHPNDFPPNYHWSPMVLAAHSDGYTMWSGGVVATTGVQSVAETGSTATITNELKSAGDSVKDFTISSPGFFPDDDSSTRMMKEVRMDERHPYLSSITMAAPSPDWFTGFHDFQPVENGMWMDSFSATTFPWDAGTDSGSTYNSANQATNPPEAVFEMTLDTLPPSNVFLSPDGQEVKPVARWECTIIISMSDTVDMSSTGDIMVSIINYFFFTETNDMNDMSDMGDMSSSGDTTGTHRVIANVIAYLLEYVWIILSLVFGL